MRPDPSYGRGQSECVVCAAVTRAVQPHEEPLSKARFDRYLLSINMEVRGCISFVDETDQTSSLK